MESKVATLSTMFPSVMLQDVINVLKANHWDMDKSIDHLVFAVQQEEKMKEAQLKQKQQQQQSNEAPLVNVSLEDTPSASSLHPSTPSPSISDVPLAPSTATLLSPSMKTQSPSSDATPPAPIFQATPAPITQSTPAALSAAVPSAQPSINVASQPASLPSYHQHQHQHRYSQHHAEVGWDTLHMFMNDVRAKIVHSAFYNMSVEMLGDLRASLTTQIDRMTAETPEEKEKRDCKKVELQRKLDALRSMNQRSDEERTRRFTQATADQIARQTTTTTTTATRTTSPASYADVPPPPPAYSQATSGTQPHASWNVPAHTMAQTHSVHQLPAYPPPVGLRYYHNGSAQQQIPAPAPAPHPHPHHQGGAHAPYVAAPYPFYAPVGYTPAYPMVQNDADYASFARQAANNTNSSNSPSVPFHYQKH